MKVEQIKEMDVSTPIPLARKQLEEAGINRLDSIATHIQQLRDQHDENRSYPYNRYLEFGSNTQTNLINPYDNNPQNCIVWCVNHYLGLNRHPKVIERAKLVLESFGTGSGTSAVSGGISSLHVELEHRLEKLLNKEKVILFPTGYTTNLGVIGGLVTPKDLILVDRDCHASIIDGCRLSHAKFLPFKHNDVNDLERKLKRFSQNYNNIFVIVESAYSMNGNISPLREIAALKDKYDFYFYVDEAHTFGFYGEGGRGLSYDLDILDKVDFFMSTLSKSTASVGGFIAANRKYITMIEMYCNAYMFQATTPPADIATILASLDIIQEHPELINRLHDNNKYFRKRLMDSGFDLGTSVSPVIPIYIRDFKKLYAISQELYDKGIYTVAVTYPAVKPTEGRLRFIVTSEHTKQQIDKTVSALNEFAKKYDIL